MNENKIVPISVVIPTYKRVNDLNNTLGIILSCNPLPSEIIVHIDSGDNETEVMLEHKYPAVKIINSETTQGPGGGRNKGIEVALNEYIASFDDDSFPVQPDYFERLYKIFELIPKAAIVESMIYHPGEIQQDEKYSFYRTFIFTGCGVAYRKSWFLKIGGYIPLAVAYGLEEVDFSMRACFHEAVFIRTSWLTVFHDTDLKHRDTSKVLSNSITNLGVLAFLRYPVYLWLYGLLQVLNRISWTIKKKHKYKESLKGLINIPCKSYRLKKYRCVLPLSVIRMYLKYRTTIQEYNV